MSIGCQKKITHKQTSSHTWSLACGMTQETGDEIGSARILVLLMDVSKDSN